jgi:hypothetical protein
MLNPLNDFIPVRDYIKPSDELHGDEVGFYVLQSFTHDCQPIFLQLGEQSSKYKHCSAAI